MLDEKWLTVDKLASDLDFFFQEKRSWPMVSERATKFLHALQAHFWKHKRNIACISYRNHRSVLVSDRFCITISSKGILVEGVGKKETLNSAQELMERIRAARSGRVKIEGVWKAFKLKRK